MSFIKPTWNRGFALRKYLQLECMWVPMFKCQSLISQPSHVWAGRSVSAVITPSVVTEASRGGLSSTKTCLLICAATSLFFSLLDQFNRWVTTFNLESALKKSQLWVPTQMLASSRCWLTCFLLCHFKQQEEAEEISLIVGELPWEQCKNNTGLHKLDTTRMVLPPSHNKHCSSQSPRGGGSVTYNGEGVEKLFSRWGVFLIWGGRS